MNNSLNLLSSKELANITSYENDQFGRILSVIYLNIQRRGRMRKACKEKPLWTMHCSWISTYLYQYFLISALLTKTSLERKHLHSHLNWLNCSRRQYLSQLLSSSSCSKRCCKTLSLSQSHLVYCFNDWARVSCCSSILIRYPNLMKNLNYFSKWS